ncbi:uncharacterized protein LOC122348620 isoform X2 [Puntigrus tetrazona]|nr:uncharacterized protein LOC122348620 isoform X2 [Puntigrus tetrazona]
MRSSDAPSAEDDRLMKISPALPRGPCFPAPLLVRPHASGLVLVPRESPGVFGGVSAARRRLFCPVFTSWPAPGPRTDPCVELFPAPQMIWTGGHLPLPRCFTFVEIREQDRNTNRADADGKGLRPQRSSRKVKTARRRKTDPPLQDLAESALAEYSQVMDALGSKVAGGSEVRDEEDVCAPFLNQLLDDSPSSTEAGLDMDYIHSLLSSDVLKDDPEPVEVQRDSRPLRTENIPEPVLDNNKDPFTEAPLANPEGRRVQSHLNASVQEALLSETDGNETLCADELDSELQKSKF